MSEDVGDDRKSMFVFLIGVATLERPEAVRYAGYRMAKKRTHVWVNAINSFGKWVFILSDDQPGSPAYFQRTLHKPIPPDQLCFTYKELTGNLRSRGFTPPPLAYFITQQEGEPVTEDIVRRVPPPLKLV